MTGKDCEIKIISRQTMGRDRETIEETYKGSFLDRGEKKYLSYKRHTEDGDVECLLSIGKGIITMNQHGKINSRLEFIPGKKTENKYTTSMGNMNIPVFTRGLSIKNGQEIIEIMLDYDIATTEAIHTIMEIEVKLNK